MPVAVDAANGLLARLCDDLRQLREEAGGPSLRALAVEVGLGKSQLGAILNGRVERLPDWRVVHGLVNSCRRFARAQGRAAALSPKFGIDEYWRRRYSALEHLLSEPLTSHKPDKSKRHDAKAKQDNSRQDNSRQDNGKQDNSKQEPVRPRGLPPRVRSFVGREAELAALSAAAGPVVIAGPAGIGKTALAVYWAHDAAPRFPDGQLYVDLRGFHPSGAVMTPNEAVRGFLEALGVPPDRVPTSPDAQIGMYRSMLADRAVLVVLDNARDADQVRPLLPTAPGCLAVVTSRSRLTGLAVAQDAQVLRLDLLSPDEATQLLAKRIGEDRLRAQSHAVESIVRACARLPLALSVVASRAALQPALSLEALAGELSPGSAGLEALAGELGPGSAELEALASELDPGSAELEAFRTGDGSTDLPAVFSWSYRTLEDAVARAFRLLGLTSGGDVALAAAASLVGEPVGAVRRILAELIDAGLLSEHRPGRYTMHDLLRAYAGELAREVDSPADRRQARHRLLDHYLHTSYRAATLIHPPFSDITPAPMVPGAAPKDLADRAAAYAWFDAEHSVLLAEVRQAARTGFGQHVWQLAWALTGYLDRRAIWQPWHELQELALRVARRDGDVAGQAHAYRDLAMVCSRLGRHDESYGFLKRALDEFTLLDDRSGMAQTHLNLGQSLERSQCHREALEHSRLAVKLFTAAGNLAGQAYSLNAVGWQLALTGNYRDAVSHCEKALARLRQVGDSQGVADTLDSLGYAHHHLGDFASAVDCYGRALAMFRADGDQFGSASTLQNLAESHFALGDDDSARTALLEAWTILDRIGHDNAHLIRERLDGLTPR